MSMLSSAVGAGGHLSIHRQGAAPGPSQTRHPCLWPSAAQQGHTPAEPAGSTEWRHQLRAAAPHGGVWAGVMPRAMWSACTLQGINARKQCVNGAASVDDDASV